MEVSGQLHAPAASPLVTIVQEAGWAPEPAWTRWWGEEFPVPAGNRTTDHPAVAQRYDSAEQSMLMTGEKATNLFNDVLSIA
jgi:hypothetical protein